MKNFIFFLFLIIGVNSCSTKTNKNQNNCDIESIYVLFYNYQFEPCIAINCDEIKRTESPSTKSQTICSYCAILDSTISDTKVLSEISKEILNLKVDSTRLEYNSIDARISAIIKSKNGIKDKLCISGNQILFQNRLQKENNRLVYLIKKNIGWYTWMSRKQMKYMDELNDPSFTRDPLLKSIEDNPLFR